MRKIYLVGSLRNPMVPALAQSMRRWGHKVFDGWFAAGPEADDHWKHYHVERGDDYLTALHHPIARHVFEFDKKWLTWADTGVLLLPAGKSCHLEIGWMSGQGKLTVGVLDDPDRWDVMYQFLDAVVLNDMDLEEFLRDPRERR